MKKTDFRDKKQFIKVSSGIKESRFDAEAEIYIHQPDFYLRFENNKVYEVIFGAEVYRMSGIDKWTSFDDE